MPSEYNNSHPAGGQSGTADFEMYPTPCVVNISKCMSEGNEVTTTIPYLTSNIFFSGLLVKSI